MTKLRIDAFAPTLTLPLPKGENLAPSPLQEEGTVHCSF
jgi:hypothetical protein